jgi:hypothetical protein
VGLFAKEWVMWMGKLTIQFMFVTVFILTGCGGVQSGQKTVLNGSLLPQDQGWSVSTNAVTPLDVATNGSQLALNTIGVLRSIDQLPTQKAFMWFYREVPFDFKLGFSIEFTLKVHEVEQSHNVNDAGIMFYGSTIDPSGNFAGGPRSQMIVFDEDAIGWGGETEKRDKAERFKMDTTDTFHTYTLTVDNKAVAKVFVDGTLALQRNKWEGISRIGFGDMTNNVGVNGSFSIRDIIVTPHPRILPSRPVLRHPRIPPSRSALRGSATH